MLEQNNTPRSSSSEPTSGILTLKPMGLGDILDTTFSLYRQHFRLFLGLVIFPVCADLALHLLLDFSQFFFERTFPLGLVIAVMAVASYIIGIGGVAIVSGATYLGEDITIRSVLQRAIDKFWQLLGCFLLWSLVVGVLAITIIGIPFSIYFTVRWGLFLGTVMFEKTTVKHALRRSSELATGMWWQLFGTLLVLLLLATLVHAIFEISIGFIFILANPGGDINFIDIIEWGLLSETFENITPLFYAVLTGIHLIVYAFSFTVWIIGLTLVYLNQRIRKEGFDIEMQASSI